MKITFIEAPYDWHDRATIKVRNYGLERLAGHLKKNGIEDISYCDFTFQKDFDISKVPVSDIYGFSAMHPNFESSLKMAELLKSRDPDSIVIFGGPSVSDLGKEILVHSFIDFAFWGICEDSFLMLIIGKPPEDIPSLLYRKEGVAKINTISKEPKGWQNIMPRKLDNILPGEYKRDHHIILGAVGCGYSCNFCNIIRMQPKLFERDIKYMVEEIKNIEDEKFSLQILHQNFSRRLRELILALESEGILGKVISIAFNSRADTFDKDEVEDLLLRFPEVSLIAYVGIENYDNAELKRLNKGLSSEENIRATQDLIALEKSYDNFDYVMTWIGYNKHTKKENLLRNIEVFEDLFVASRSFKDIGLFFSSPLRKTSTTGDGHYVKDFEDMPSDKETREAIIAYKNLISSFGYVSFAERRDLHFSKILKGLPSDENILWQELDFIKRLLNKESKKL